MKNRIKNQIDLKIKALQTSKRNNYLLAIGFFGLLVMWPIIIPGIYILAIAVPMVFFFACFMAFLTEGVEKQKGINALKKSFFNR